jgi:hypothetical protein
LALVAAAGTALCAAPAELGRTRGLRVRPGFSVCRAALGTVSGSTMQVLGGPVSGGGTCRGSGSGSRPGPTKPSVSSSESAAPGPVGGGSESDRVGRDSLTDVGGVSSGPGAPIRSWERALLSELPGDAGAGAAGRALRCSNSQGDTRHRSTSCGDVERRARGPRKGRLSPASPAAGGSTCSKDTDRDSSTSVECGEPTSAGSEGVVAVGVVTVGEASGPVSPPRRGLRDRRPLRSGLRRLSGGDGERGCGAQAAGAGSSVADSTAGLRAIPGPLPSPGVRGSCEPGKPQEAVGVLRGPFCTG